MIELTKQTTIGEIPIVVRKEGLLTEGKWYAKTYEDFKKIGDPSRKWYEGMPVVSEKEYYDTQLNRQMKRGDRKVTSLITYIYVDEDYTCENGLRVDDEGCIYVNDDYFKINGWGTEATPIVMEFKKGWNKVECIYWNGTGNDGLLFENKLAFDKNIKRMQYDKDEEEYFPHVLCALEDIPKDISIKPVPQKSNYGSSEAINSEMFYDYQDMSLFTMPTPLYGGVRFRMEHYFSVNSSGDWRYYWTKMCYPKYRPFLFKPNTKYTMTYYTHEYHSDLTGLNKDYPSPRVRIGDMNAPYEKTVGFHSTTFTTDRTATLGNYSPFAVLYHAYSSEPIPEGAKRVIDIELISIVEGEEPETKPTPFFSSVGGKDGFLIYSQDYLPKLGEYSLEGEIPEILNNIENRIEKNHNQFEITWI